MTVAEQLVRCLEHEGVTYIFGVPGEENEDLLFALDDSSITFVPTRHEQGAAFIANVWGRLTGEAGVCLATLGPGATNLLTGVADANLDKAPLVAITGQGSIGRLHHESHQLLDVVNLFRPVTKWNTSIPTPEITTEVVRKAFKVATSEKPGATHIELPEDIAQATVADTQNVLPIHTVRRPRADAEALKTAAALLAAAERPLVLAGNGAIRKRASRDLTALVEAYNIPVVSTFMGKGAVSDRRSQSLLALGLGFKDYVMEAVEAADVILTVGYDIAEYPPESWNPDRSHTIIHIDFAEAEVYTHYAPDVEIVGDIAGTISELHQHLKTSKVSRLDDAWYAPIRQRILDDVASYDLEEDEPFTIPGTLNIVRDLLPDNGLLISDVGSHKMWIARNFPTYCPNGCIISNGLASMGIALPGGIAATLVDAERPVVAAMGDGGFLMNAQELETAKRLGVGFTCLVFNDNDYGLISWKQERSHGRSVSTRISNPDFRQFAESFGIQGYRPETLGDLQSCLRESIASRQLTVIEVPIDPSVNSALVHKLETYWTS